ncbi:MAG TPA: ABC transporter permease [Bryobacteraceae bacterium]|nr:ABC transporter permease [Bryobacteraceae bacterium]
MRFKQDLLFALRMLRRNPGFTLIAGLTLALGIGANTAIFSLVNAVLLRPLSYPDPQQLVAVKDDLRGLHLSDVGMSLPELQDFADRSGVFADISAVWPISANLTGSEQPERVEALAVSPGYFNMLGATAQLGRVFGPQDRATGFAEAAILSDGLWKRLFGGDPHILGKQIRVDTDLYSVVGVMPRNFRHPGRTIQGNVEVWITAGFAAAPFPVPPQRGIRLIPGAVARLRPDLSVQQAQLKLDAFAAGMARDFPKEYPASAKWVPVLTPLQQDLTGNLRTTLLLVFGAVLFVLLICCVSIANLTVAKAIGRQREISVRRALGAPLGTLVRQLLTESLLVSLLGGIVGWLVVGLAAPILPQLVPAALPVSEIEVNGPVLWFALGISMLAGVAFGLAPVVPMVRTNIITSLKEGTRGTTVGGGHNRLRSVLVGCEIAFSLMLMVGAGLLLHSFWNLMQVDPGFNPKKVLVAGLWLPVPNDPSQARYGKPAERAALVREVLRLVREIPGVESAAIGNGTSIPLVGSNSRPFTPEGYTGTQGEQLVAEVTSVSTDFFQVLQTRLARGRVFNDADDGRNLVAIVDETAVKRAWPNQDPIGRKVLVGPGGPLSTIVGVVANIKTDSFEATDAPHIYFPIYQRSGPAMAIYLRTGQDPATLGEALRRQVRKVDPDLPLFGIRTMEEVVARSLAQRRFQLQTIGAFAAVALLLAGIGIYGVTAFWVNQRTAEIGIRIALGANDMNVIGMVVRQGLSLTFWGVVAGLAGAIPLSLLLRTLLFGTTPFDPLTFGGISILLSAAAIFACVIPARRATRVDPVVALRSE